MSCFLCLTSDKITECQECHHVSYCGDHAIHHRGLNGQCLPFMVKQTRDRGKCVVSTRDISKGDLILVDTPLIVAPHTKSKPQCLQCVRYDLQQSVFQIIYLSNTFHCSEE